jgi:hypothetical protein
MKGSNNKLWNDHGDVLKRVVGQSVAVPTKIKLSDALLAWKLVRERQGGDAGDSDAVNVVNEVEEWITARWDTQPDDLIYQSDECINYLHRHLSASQIFS